MDFQTLAAKSEELLTELSQLGHGEGCESLNYQNSAPCDCRLTETKILATEVIAEVLELLSDYHE